MMGKGKKGKKVSTGKKVAAGVAGAGLIGGAGYGLRKYANANPTGRIAAAKNAASDLATRIGAGFSSRMGGVIRRGRALGPANSGSLSRTLARMGHSKIAKVGDFARANKGRIAGGVALLGASGLGAAYFANSKKSRKARNIKVS